MICAIHSLGSSKAQNLAKMADLEAEVARLLQQIPTAGSNADQLELLHRAREIVLNRDPSGAVLRVALPFLQTLLHQQNAPLVAAILQLLGDATPRDRSVCLDLFEAVATVLLLSYSTEKNVLRALDLATLHLLDAFQVAATTTDHSISSDLWQRVATAIDHAADVLLSMPILLHTDSDNNNRSGAVFLRVWKLLERAVLLLSEAKDATVYRDPARSNVQPDAITVDLVSPTHSSLNRDTLLVQGDALLRRMIDRLLSTPAGAAPLACREICVAINSLSLVAAMRPQLVGIVIPALIAYHATAPSDRAVHSTLKANLVKLLSLPASLELADEVTECVIVLGDGERAFRAISKSKDPKNRRKYVSAPSEASLRKARIGKRTAEQISESADAKRARVPASTPAATVIDERVTDDGLVNMPSTTVVELVLEGFTAALPPPPPAVQLMLPPSEVKSRMASLLARLATPSSVLALDKSLRRSRDPRRIHQSNSNHQQPSLVPILDDGALEETSDWISKNTTTVEEPIVSVADDNSIQVFLKPVSPAWCRDMAAAALTRILENEYGASLRGDDALREALVCRLATSPWLLLTDERNNVVTPADKSLPPVYQTVLDFVLQDTEHRAPLACALLRHEFVRVSNELLSENAGGEEPQDAPPCTGDAIYRTAIAYFLPALLTSLDLSASNDKKLFGSVIAGVPRVTAEVFDVILRLFADPFKSAGGAVLGITVLRDLVRERASCSTYALKLLLKFTGDADESTRNASIRCVANQLYVMETLKPSIEDHAQRLVTSLEGDGAATAAAAAAENPAADHNEENQDVDMSEPADSSWLAARVARLRADEDQYATELREFVTQAVAPESHAIDSEAEVLRRVELLLALCARKPSLLVPLVAAYAATTELARQIIFQAIEKLIKHWKQRAGGVAQVVAQLHGFPPASLGLVSHIVQLLSSTAPTAARKDATGNSNAELVSHVLQLYETYAKEHVPDGVAVMLPLLSSVPPPTLEPLLPALLSLPTNKWSVALTRVFDALPPQLLGPMDLLLSLHHVDLTQDVTMQKKVIAAVNFCVEHRHAFPAEALLHVCKLLVQESRIPKLALRTLILSVTTYPSLQQDAARLLPILAERQVWGMDEEALWKGFVKCAALLQPASFPMLLSLPLSQLEGVLSDEQELRPLLRSYVESEDKPQDLVVDDAVKDLLLQVTETQGDAAEPMEQEDDGHHAEVDS